MALDALDQLTLNEIARMAYGSREHDAGGRGNIGILKDPATGKPRIIKYDTHFWSRSSADCGDRAQLDAANALRKELLALAANAKLSGEDLQAVRRQLGLVPNSIATEGDGLLKRTDVAQVVRMIDGDIWRKAFAGKDAASYSTRSEKTSFASVTGAGAPGPANRAHLDSGTVQANRREKDTILNYNVGWATDFSLSDRERELVDRCLGQVMARRLESPEPPTTAEQTRMLRSVAALALAVLGRADAVKRDQLLGAREYNVHSNLGQLAQFAELLRGPQSGLSEDQFNLLADRLLEELTTKLDPVALGRAEHCGLPRNTFVFGCIGRAFERCGFDLGKLVPEKASRFLSAIDACPTFDPGDPQGVADRNRVCRQVFDLCIRRNQLPQGGAERQAVDADIAFVVDRVNMGFADPLPFGQGPGKSAFSPVQKRRILASLQPEPNLFSEDLEAQVMKQALTIFKDACRGMGLTLNGLVINPPGHKYEGSALDIIGAFKAAFTGPGGQLDEKGLRLVLRHVHQGGMAAVLDVDEAPDRQPGDRFYSPTGMDLNNELDGPFGATRTWGFDVSARHDGSVSVHCTYGKEGLPVAPLRRIDLVGVKPFADLRGAQRPLASGTNRLQVDVEYTYRYDNGEVTVELPRADATYEFQRVLADDEVAAKDEETLQRLMQNADELADGIRPFFSETGKFKKYDWDANRFKAWMGENRARIIGEFRELNRGSEEVFKTYYDKYQFEEARLRAPKSVRSLLYLISKQYALAIGESPEKARRAEVGNVVISIRKCVALARKVMADSFTDEDVDAICANVGQAKIEELVELRTYLNSKVFSTPDRVLELKERLSGYLPAVAS